MARLDSFLRLVAEQRASDLHFHAGDVPKIRHDGELIALPFRVLSSQESHRFLMEVLTLEQRAVLEAEQQVDVLYDLSGVGRFRGNVFVQSQGLGAVFRVTKNTLARIAVADTPYAPLDALFTGPTAIAYSADPVAAPKAAVTFARRNDKLAIVGGALPGNLLTTEQVRALAELPSIDELRARMIGLLTTPAARLVGVLQAPGGQLARVLAARAEQG